MATATADHRVAVENQHKWEGVAFNLVHLGYV